MITILLITLGSILAIWGIGLAGVGVLLSTLPPRSAPAPVVVHHGVPLRALRNF